MLNIHLNKLLRNSQSVLYSYKKYRLMLYRATIVIFPSKEFLLRFAMKRGADQKPLPWEDAVLFTHAKGNIIGETKLGECLLTEKNQEHIVVGKSTPFC